MSIDPAAYPSVATVIVNFKTPELTVECLHALAGERADIPGLRAIVVDNASGDGSVEKLQSAILEPALAGWIEFIPLDLNGGFGWGNNQAMLHLMQSSRPPEFIHLLNPDAVIEPGAVAKLLALLQSRPRVAAAGSQLLETDGRLAGSAFRFPTIAREFLRGSNTAALGRLLGIAETVVDSDAAVSAEWVTGASVMFRAEALREAGLFDDGFFLYFEEIELMWRLRQSGWDIWYEPASRVCHIGGAATGIASGGSAVRAPRPDYWFQSRRRLFALLYGPGKARLAGMAWLLGNLFWRLRRAIGSGNPDRDIPGERQALLAHGLLPDRRDLTPAVVAWDSQPGRPPAWSTPE